jgi:hypothetical protein
MTEREDGEDTEYSEIFNGKAKHRKYAGVLDRKQFNRFVREQNLYAEETETMGMIGAPPDMFGWMPAISFSSYDDDVIKGAYVCPLPDVELKREITKERSERCWQRLRRAILNTYGNGW